MPGSFGTRPARFRHLGGEHDPAPPHARTRAIDRGRRTAITLCALLYRMRVEGLDSVPGSGPVVFVANHQNFMDGSVLFGLLPRRVSFLIKAEAVRGALGWLLTTVGQYSLERGVPDREPLLRASAQLRAGGAIGVFPEGTRGEGLVAAVYPGAAWLAVRNGATVVPVALRGTARPKGRRRRRFRPVVAVLVGEPMTVQRGAGRGAVAAVSEQVQRELAGLVVRLDTAIATAGGSAAVDAEPARSW